MIKTKSHKTQMAFNGALKEGPKMDQVGSFSTALNLGFVWLTVQTTVWA